VALSNDDEAVLVAVHRLLGGRGPPLHGGRVVKQPRAPLHGVSRSQHRRRAHRQRRHLDVRGHCDCSRRVPLQLLLVFGRKATEESSAGAAASAKEERGVEETPQSAVESFMLQHTRSGNSWKKIQGKGLHQLGLDSLEIVQLRNLFNKKFSVNAPLRIFADVSLKLSELSRELVNFMTTG